MRWLVLMLFACSAPPPPPPVENSAPVPARVEVPVEPTPGCVKLAARLGPLGGPTAYGGPKPREQMLAKMCTTERWGPKAIDCVVTADHDPLSCLRRPYLTERQDERWNDVFRGY